MGSLDLGADLLQVAVCWAVQIDVERWVPPLFVIRVAHQILVLVPITHGVAVQFQVSPVRVQGGLPLVIAGCLLLSGQLVLHVEA
jgi:hypothetical protein